jgi:hypothetical protein
MMEAKFKIGDRVKVIPGEEHGIITDIMFSNKFKVNLYEVISEDDGDVLLGRFVADDLESAPKARNFSMDIRIDIAQNIVIATLYENCDTVKKPLRRGHGHIIHDGELGIAQAASYACRRLYESLGGSFDKGGYRRDQ